MNYSENKYHQQILREPQNSRVLGCSILSLLDDPAMFLLKPTLPISIDKGVFRAIYGLPDWSVSGYIFSWEILIYNIIHSHKNLM